MEYSDMLFDRRSSVAEKLKCLIRDRGYTKFSLAKKADISRPTLDKLLNSEVNNKCTFDKHIRKILDVFNMSEDELLVYSGKSVHTVDAVYSAIENPTDQTDFRAEDQYELLQSLLDICSVYY